VGESWDCYNSGRNAALWVVKAGLEISGCYAEQFCGVVKAGTEDLIPAFTPHRPIDQQSSRLFSRVDTPIKSPLLQSLPAAMPVSPLLNYSGDFDCSGGGHDAGQTSRLRWPYVLWKVRQRVHVTTVCLDKGTSGGPSCVVRL
jgi:hypothetical protein